MTERVIKTMSDVTDLLRAITWRAVVVEELLSLSIYVPARRVSAVRAQLNKQAPVYMKFTVTALRDPLRMKKRDYRVTFMQ